MTENTVAEMTFEAAMGELEGVVTRLETGDVALEDAIKLYERGAELRAHCEGRLKSAEAKVEAITLGPDGTPKGTEPLDGA